MDFECHALHKMNVMQCDVNLLDDILKQVNKHTCTMAVMVGPIRFHAWRLINVIYTSRRGI